MKEYKRLWGVVAVSLVLVTAFAVFDGANRTLAQSPGPSPDQVPLDPASIPMFANELPIPRVFAPTVVQDGSGNVIRHEYTVSIAQTRIQMLPPGFPMTTVLAYGGQVEIPGSSVTEFVRTVPGPVFDNTRGIPSLVQWRNEIFQPHFMPVDPTLHWANPLRMEPPVAPFLPFPPGYTNAQYPVPHVTHTHGLVVENEMDGLAEQWFTPFEHRGPDFHTRDYLMPNDQPSTQLFYHDHTMGMTRLNVQSGLVGVAYFIRDPNEPLDQPGSPLPGGEYEIPLALMTRGFFTDGEINFPRSSNNPDNAYHSFGSGGDTSVVNGKVWPNLNVERRQYRFRMLGADNSVVFNVTLDNNGTPVPMTLIGAGGGYLPAPQVVENFQIGITERADVLIDFSGFAPGTRITMLNANIDPADPRHQIMQFTVQDTPVVPPEPLPPVLVARPTLTPDAPGKLKVMRVSTDARGNVQTLLDGLHFTSPITEYSLVGSTERWDLVQLAGANHQIHLHLIEFQILERRPIDSAAYNQEWLLVNGFKPAARPIVVDPEPFFTGPPEPPLPYETGWKDTVRSPGNMMSSIVARWAPQEIPAGGSIPGVNQFPIDPTTGRGYLWHCHVLAHEDNDMMRPLVLVNAWEPGVDYEADTVIAYQDVNYRVRLAHTSQASEPPDTRFDLWERVNNNNGDWAPQIIYDVGDRVRHNGQIFQALAFHQAQPAQTPPANPLLWEAVPETACAQFAQFCHDEANPVAAECHDLGHAGDEQACLADLELCLSACTTHAEPPHTHTVASPCHGLCPNPVEFEVADGSDFQSGALGTGATCHATNSKLESGTCNNFTGGRVLMVNGEVQPCNGDNWAEPLPPERNDGYCIQTTAGDEPWAAFATW